ncbi:hypothetical protein JCM11641_006601 [Rhodosporidiobolus odoratus]
MSLSQTLARPAVAPPTQQEIERKLGSPTVPSPPAPTLSTSMETTLSAGGVELQRRYSGNSRKQPHVSLSSGEEEEASPPLRPVAHLSAISETDDALASGSESDASSIGGEERSRSRSRSRSGRPDLNPVRTSRDSGGLSDNVALKSGYLMKKGEKRKTWKKRWFVLRGGQVAMYKTDKEYRLLRLIPITDVHSVSPVSLKKHPYAFGIVTPRRTYYIEAPSLAEVHVWCHLIDRAKNDYRAGATMTSIDTPTSANADDDDLASGAQTMQAPTPIAGSPKMTPRAGSYDPSSSFTAEGSSSMPIPSPSLASLGRPILGADGYVTSSSGGLSAAFAPSSYASTTSSHGPSSPLSNPITIAPSPEYEVQSLDAGVSQLSLGLGLGAAPGGKSAIPQRSSSGRSDSLAVPGVAMGAMSSGIASSSEDEDGFDVSSSGYDYSQADEGQGLYGSPGSYLPPPAMAAPPQPIAEADPNKVILSGYLMKQGKRKNWRKRWFVLQSGMLMYSRSHMDTKFHRQIPLTSILDALEFSPGSTAKSRNPLSPSSPTQPTHHSASGAGPEHCFKVITPKRTYLCCAPSEEDEIKWLAALQCLVARRTQAAAMGASLSTPLSPPIPAPAAQQPGRSFSNPVAVASAPPPAPSANAAKRTPSQSQSSPPGSRPLHGRQRSVTDAARQAVREVERRFHPVAPTPQTAPAIPVVTGGPATVGPPA